MRHFKQTLTDFWKAFLLFCACGLVPLSATAQTGEFEVRKIADDVYVALRKEPPGLTVNANSVFIINDEEKSSF